MKTDYALVLGNPDTSYFLHFQRLSTYYLLSMLDVSAGNLIYQIHYNQATTGTGALMNEKVVSGTQYVATCSHTSTSLILVMTTVSATSLTPSSFEVSTSLAVIGLMVFGNSVVFTIVYGNINSQAN